MSAPHDNPMDAYLAHLQRAIDGPETVTDGGTPADTETDMTLTDFLNSPDELERRLERVLGTVEVAPGVPACEIAHVTRESVTVVGVYAPRDGRVEPARVWRLANHPACVAYEGVTTVNGERVPELLVFERTRTFDCAVDSVKELQQALKPVFGCGISL